MDANETGSEPVAPSTIDATLWAFLRGDMAVRDFELRVYSDDGLETVFGAALYLALISADWRDRHVVAELRLLLEAFARPRLACECITLRDVDVVPMGFTDRADRFFATVGPRHWHDGEEWWLFAARCSMCGQHWLGAQDEQTYDAYALRRLSPSQGKRITADGVWPDEFRTYERVLAVAGGFAATAVPLAE
ncbi:hypothetical protein SAMN05880582_10194 [Rhizobium sp. RU20A]|uniref:hypothetical protein n=1 Tax=Rhizobium sp. RU20A TaxID=1907412 RepID=UPI000956E4EB|nr:hypothetical protein [Rhizobium sp. RU20A]SIP93954.1 hypothetical protein SAMN05880582_10194 [Rhizobium sp. RU20A]